MSDERQYLSSLQAAQTAEALPKATWALYLMIAFVVCFIGWAAWAQVDEVARAEGRLVPDGKEQVIASLEPGLLGELLVREGQQVVAGQELVRLDPTRVEAAENEGALRRLALMATAARLSAEANGTALSFPPELKEGPRFQQAERESFEARRRALDDGLAGLSRSIGLVERELAMARQMAQQGLMSNVEVMRLTRQVSELQASRSQQLSRFRQDAAAELVKVKNELAVIEEQMVVRQDQLKRTTLTSPVAGVVKSIKVNTVGGVVTSGAPIMEIAPIGGRVIVEARVKPKDVGFVTLDQAAEVKLSGYDYSLYGGLHAKVNYISPDAFGDPDKNPDASYYRVLVVADRNTLKPVRGEPAPLIPGMAATVEIKTGQRSVLSVLLRPMLKSQEALRER
ncbi:HlyD family efflux transporter periplasmic adaptor subunit [Inhella crocodyli]|uniref:HlyD family efflux transporter periplasmic adaptor subunit n=1 Tax=Inhella crocodyli TaxID=2499851 RepID=A0A3S2UYB9_9BURK|nr:HlyD family efflux transporter periplasmic adaptor subunit [Inhella crocodyli]RVT88097.1 HlyD family efflux transporter periplasmic adaptor subunit [Inhella crocodyli]